ncbi:uncharacterized protein LOC131627728 [Vicia villosa]|uniref:uncharacterized protein LOC131627728 n=1 Tax=Vicia villosa TaxID=3911 RepID=UPI00273B5739|nr:uncharacterized protein LOC131627728 [Vicia villosa]
MTPSPPPPLTELERRLEERFSQLQMQRTTDLEEIRALIQSHVDLSSSSPSGRQRSTGPRNSNNNSYATRISKVEFPRFDGKNVCEWLYKCDQFFLLDGTPQTSMVRLASIHLDGLALQWHLNYMRHKFDIYPSWQQYVTDVTTRFGDVYEDPLSSLLQVKHTGKVQDYIDQFELALTQVTLLPEHSLSIFLAGLDHHMQMQVRMFNPSSIAHAANLAKLHEASQTSLPQPKSRFQPFSKFQGVLPKPSVAQNNTQSQNPQVTPTTFSPKSNPQRPFRTFSAIEMAERRAKDLCMFCDEQFTPGHQFKHKRSHLMVLEVDEDDNPTANTSCDSPTPEPDSFQDFDNPQLSFHSLTGIANFHTMRVTGLHDKKMLHILLDSGNTHNFLDLEIAKAIGCKLEAIPPLSVTGGGGHKLEAAFICRGFKWQLQQAQFTADVIVLPLVCCDLILGIQWLKSLGPLLWDFDKLQMEFSTNGRKFVLRGAKTPSFKVINNKSFAQVVHKGAEMCFLSIGVKDYSMGLPTCHALQGFDSQQVLPPSLVQLLDQYSDIFAEPTALPPSRPGFDHKIPFKEGTQPFNLRPYRFSIVQKDIIDNIVQDMLKQGIVQHSNSPFASPIILVRKKDDSWRLCVDFRRLNDFTIKDRFPIPLIEDLMDELHGATVFSKLDMRSGYHQLRMAHGEEHKTAFKTHNGHFEYLVMPFGLTNAPASFQALMNQVFQQFLRKFVIIFFDDLLVYSKSFEDHLAHIHLIFQTIRDNHLFLNKNKCAFAEPRVEYLGHFITKEGVSTDPAKILAVSSWPVPSTIKQLRGFLGLAGYYRRFVKDFGKLAKPLIDLLKKDSFFWSSEANFAFQHLKQALISAPVLSLPNFAKKNVVETDASGKGIGAVLMQDHHPIAYISKSLGPKQQALFVYERELLAIVYEEGSANAAADALSRKAGAELLALVLGTASSDLLESIHLNWQRDPQLSKIISDMKQKPDSHPKYTWIRDELRRRGKLVIGSNPVIKETILQWLHSSSI